MKTKNNFFNKIKEGFALGIGFFIFLGIVFGVYAVGFHPANEILSGNFTGTYNFTGNVYGIIPTGFIGSFNLASCPNGWKQSDGTLGTLDLRGQFLRGLNSFDGGSTTRSDGKEDPDGASRTLGNYQNDTFKSHTHGIQFYGSGSPTLVPPNNYLSILNGYNPTANNAAGGIIPTGDNETRPKNIAVIFCEKI